ncbi:hypothetical protein [Halocatena halophila]|uniref:hypothetical protein n=1 Tax=Halocatena halophila TaxID=2814576 RepID=UPI002ED1FD41
MEADQDQSIDTNESTAITKHSRRDMLQAACSVGLGMVTFAGTAAATSDPSPDERAPSRESSFSSNKRRSDDVETLAVYPSCVWKSGNPGATIRGGSCARHAYSNSWDYAGYILDTYPGLDDCRWQISVAGEIEAHAVAEPGESITIGCDTWD